MKDLGDVCGTVMPVSMKEQRDIYQRHRNLESSSERFRRWLQDCDVRPHEGAACHIGKA